MNETSDLNFGDGSGVYSLGPKLRVKDSAPMSEVFSLGQLYLRCILKELSESFNKVSNNKLKGFQLRTAIP